LASEGLFAPLFAPPAVRAAVADAAWLQAMLDVEAALAAVQARAGLVPARAAEAIAAACRAERFDAAALGEAAIASANPVVPLVGALREAVDEEAARWVHHGATSQDVLDSAAMLLARAATAAILAELDGAARACAGLARAHRDTPVTGRTLLQPALPTTFGLKAAGWLAGLTEARAGLVAARSRLAVQLGGAAGTLASLGTDGPAVMRALAAELGLAAPALPWHTARGRVAALGGALAVAAGSAGKAALDVVLLAQGEVGEVAEGGEGGGSSTMPHKRNPVASVRAVACARRVPGAVGVLQQAMLHEHERAAGSWHAEWEPLCDALALTGGALGALRAALEDLVVDAERMRANLDAAGPALLAERVALALAEQMDRAEAHAAVRAAVRRGGDLRAALLAEPRLRGRLQPAELDALLDPAGYLGAAGAFVDAAVDDWEREVRR
jgi:3-carboxy-cis,cis-muconate cycloisomerase